MKQLFFVFLVFALFSCREQIHHKTPAAHELTRLSKTAKEDGNGQDSVKKINVDFSKNRELLDIILLLPKDAFSSWDWTPADRALWYNQIKANNYYIDNNPDFFTQQYLEPTKAGFSIVDGLWRISLYHTSENSIVVMTDDIVGDGHTLNCYEVKANKILRHLDINSLLPNCKELLMKKNADKDCGEKIAALDELIVEYDFSNKGKLEMGSSWQLLQEDYENCLIGNMVLCNFNPKNKRFEPERVYWKPTVDN